MSGAEELWPLGQEEAAQRVVLDRLLADPMFHASDRNRRFLRFVTEEMLAGRGDHIKSYTIAVDVFGRAENFDGSSDPIVRIQANRLRAALAAYYAGPGRDEEVQISIPKGGYVPAFIRGDRATGTPLQTNVAQPPTDISNDDSHLALPTAPPGTVKRNKHILLLLALLGVVVLLAGVQYGTKAVGTFPPVLLIESNLDHDPNTSDLQIGVGFSRSLAMALSRFDGLRVFDLPAGLSQSIAQEKLKASGEPHGEVYVLKSGARREGSLLRLWWKLEKSETGEMIWSDVADHAVSDGMSQPVEDQAAAQVAAAIGQPLGIVAGNQIQSDHQYSTGGYVCVLQARAYFLAVSETLHQDVRDCLEETVMKSPDYAEAYAMLAWMYLEEARNEFNVRATPEDALQDASRAAHRAIELAPNSATAHEAMMAIYYRLGDFDAAFTAGKRAVELNPNNPELLGSLGTRLFARGQWDEGATLVRQSFERTLIVQPLDRVTLVLDAYRKGDFNRALEEAQQLAVPKFYGQHLLLAAIYGKLGKAQDGKKAVAALLELRPDYGTQMRDDLRARHYTEPMIDMIADGLKRAGLNVH